VQLRTPRHSGDVETALYRIVQEAVTNAVRHAGAERVEIAISEADGVLQVRVADDGNGFDPGAPRAGFGLTGMSERVALLHGDLEVASSASGTTVSAALPAP
jgi:signal transduction histidine kinase